MSDTNGRNQNDKKKPSGGGFFFFLFLIMLGFFAFTWIFRLFSYSGSNEISYNEFLAMIQEHKVDTVVIEEDRIVITPVTTGAETVTNWLSTGGAGKTYYTGKVEEDETLTKRLLDSGVKVSGKIPSNSSTIWYVIFVYILPTVLFLVFGIFLIRRISKGGGMGFMDVGKSKAKVYVEKSTGVTFEDVQGVDEAIESIKEVVDFLHQPERYVKIGARLPKGVLLVGPPGTGKTLLAKACAGEAKVPFFSLTGSDFVELYVGVGASRVRDLFKEAEKMAPCIVFIDEIDAIGRSRDSKYGGGNEEREQTLNQLLSEMDGFDGNKGIIILAATNRPEILDKALLRPGRFDRRVVVEKPDLKGRVAILKVHAKNVKLDESVNFNEIALATSGATGSDLANMVNEAAITAVKEGRQFVSQKDLLNAVEIVLVGKEKKDRILTKKEKKIVAYHEIGHAMITALQKNSEPVQKITIVPRTMGTLGYVMQVPEEETYLNSKEELHDEIVVLLGGRACEELFFDSITTGAANDIERATNIARSMVALYGMSERFGNAQFETVESRYLDGRVAMNCADKTAAEIDKEIMQILKDCYKEAYKMLKKNRDIIEKLAKHLYEKETITGREFMEIYCKEKGIPVPPPKDNSRQFGEDSNTPVKKPENVPTPVVVPAPVIDVPKEEKKEENYAFGISKEEMDELNRVVDEEIRKEQEKDLPVEENPLEEAPVEDSADDYIQDEVVPENVVSEVQEETPTEEENAEPAPASDQTEGNSADDEFMEVLRKRSEGKNDEVK
ncbi:MAG: ATP-dependent zinc metalloprotease FtsH [Lachnospiraceae bacterium]|nr:ATP-dependent zinc metalloprotease FtsH [Lachnospiraceae bacterium]